MSLRQVATDNFIAAVEERLSQAKKDKVPFSEFLEEKMDRFDYSNTSLAKKVFHRIERQDEARYVPVTRQTIGSWIKGSMPSSREIYISLGLAFEMSLEEINYILLENYMGYGLYCKNIEDAIWIAVINGVFSIQDFEIVKENIEKIFVEETEKVSRAMTTVDLWVILAQANSAEQFYSIIREYVDEFRDGAKRFGQCLDQVIEEEYGYYEKAAWFLRDIGCLHCEAQFSKIRTGKAIVTREWLLRFCISLQPSLASIEKLLAKAQMEPLGISPVEVIIAMIAEYKSDSVANSHEIWIMIEDVCQELKSLGYQIEEDLCRKYIYIYEMTPAQKWWFSLCVGYQLMQNEKNKEYGYEKAGYCRHVKVDQLLFEDVNRVKKSAAFKKNAMDFFAQPTENILSLPYQEIPNLTIEKGFVSEEIDLEKFQNYCYIRKPKKLSREVVYNDIYFYSAILYSIWTGKCFQYGQEEQSNALLQEEFQKCGLQAGELLEALAYNLSLDAAYDDRYTLPKMFRKVYELCKNR